MRYLKIKETHFIIGFGEIGKAIGNLLSHFTEELYIYDITYPKPIYPYPQVDFIHICFPYDKDFIPQVVKYARKYSREETIIIIHSTVKPLTSETLQYELNCPVVYSPVRGMHPNMTDGLIKFEKFFSILTPIHFNHFNFKKVEKLFEQMKLKPIGKIEKARSLEFAKLINTNYHFLLIAFWQEVIRLCKKHDLNIDTIRDFIATTAEKNKDRIVLPYVQGVGNKPGDHCLEPNARILSEYSDLPKMVLDINQDFKKLFGTKKIRI